MELCGDSPVKVKRLLYVKPCRLYEDTKGYDGPVGVKNMKNRKKEIGYEAFAEALLSIKTKDECLAFLEDICTINELDSLSQRLEVAKLLKEEMTYTDIAAKTGASTATISRVNKALVYGSGGYETVLNRFN